MLEIVPCNTDDFQTLANIWERSVRATHFFLEEKDIVEIKSALIPNYFPNVDLYAVIDNEIFVGFIGLSADRIEMLFIDSYCRGKGYGSLLINFAKENGAKKVDVNEQNISALKFYNNHGFRIKDRQDKDEAGRPYPILHRSL